MGILTRRSAGIVAPFPRQPAPASSKTLTQTEAQEVVDACTALLDGFKVLLVLSGQGNAQAADALRQWRRVLADVATFGG